ncbi:APC family permease [Mesoplasma lactucae]|uniref:Amino acid permease n=1 Tax=Mesoplasma lactucae ATCC 49193 TaxID=81460 RepID=A0A291ISP4_9MOLU|nr:APC family permease [Mesoplasma lactucae]ATG97726.1 amino acid permease [Mesoplasma lactucae ATCC 49193]ATZ20499.1 amino acid permease [Mesoplasma lactucae ATCC 49193]MCL8216670.1 hypothetical protein [Mesoplasma lactucae ATCC 49193]
MKKFSNTKAFEFMTLFVMVIGTVIGAGIYIKNTEVLKATQNPIIGIILWAIVGIVCVLCVLVFMEISSATKHFGNGTIANWAKIFVNRKTASYFSLLYTIIIWPAMYSLFAGTFIFYLLKLMNVEMSSGTQLAIYLGLGIFSMIMLFLFNAFLPAGSKWVQVIGNAFKFIPLFVALIAGFCMINDNSAMFNNGYKDSTWSTSDWEPSSFFRGFGGILLSFDGFYLIANSQKTAKHKEVVPKALMAGMTFAALFYVLMAVSLFLGSPDGSIFELFAKMSGGNATVARVIPAIIMMLICLLNLNSFTMFSMSNLESDVEAKLVYTGVRRGKISNFKSGLVQLTASIISYSIYILMGFFITRNGYGGWDSAKHAIDQAVTDYTGIMGSVAAILSFAMVDILIFACLINRRTNKVKVEKYKGVTILGTISGIAIAIFVICGIYTFIDSDPTHSTKFSDTTGMYFLILFIVMMVFVTIVFFIQEALFKKYPFKDGFGGYLTEEDPMPLLIAINPIKNYFTKKGQEEVKQYEQQDKPKNKRKRN